MEGKKLNILIACLNWGVGHASRSVPIINFYKNNGHKITIVSDGRALNFLRKETNADNYIRVKDVKIKYSSSKFGMLYNIINSGLKIKKMRRKEHLTLLKIHHQEKFDLVISDNRYGIFLPKIYSILITHQLNPIAPFGRFFIRNILANWTNKFDELWIPDFSSQKLTQSLSDGYHSDIRFIEPLSRLKPKTDRYKAFDYLFILSGPEPSRTHFEELIINQCKLIKDKKIALIRGTNKPFVSNSCNHITVFNLLHNSKLEELILASNSVICRGGYSTIMDLIALNVSAFLVPTPGQWEQEYICAELKNNSIYNSCSQDEFGINNLSFFDKPNLKIRGVVYEELKRVETMISQA